MASETTYFVCTYDNLSGGSFTELSTTELSWDAGGSTGFIVTNIESGTTGKLYVALISGVVPNNNDQLTQGAVTADTSGGNVADGGDAEVTLFPAYFRRDVAVSAAQDITWTGPADQVTHSFLFDGQTSNVVAGEILTFSGGQQCEVITVVSDAGASGELDVRWITPTDTGLFPDDNDTFTGDIAGDGALDGVVHPRSYQAVQLHRLLADLNDDPDYTGNDIVTTYKPTPSTQEAGGAIVTLQGTCNITDEVARHLYGGSITQGSGNTRVRYSGLAVQITDRDGLTEPVIIQNDSIVTKYWANALNPNSIQGRIRTLIKTIENGVPIDGSRVRAKLLRYGDSYFTASTTLGTGQTALALFSVLDGNNQTAVGTVAGAPYNSIVLTEGYQTIDFNNGNGSTPFGLSIDIGTASRAQTYERTKYIQRDSTSETLFGRNAQLFDGINLDFAYDGESGGPFSEDEIVAWGVEVPYTGESGGPFTVGNVIEGGTSGARGRIIYLDDQGTTGTILVEPVDGPSFSNTETITEYNATGATGASATTGTVVTNTQSGRGLLVALNDAGATGNLYLQLISGLAPVDNQTVFGATSFAQCDVNGAVNTRVVNNQFVGVFTGSNFQTNFGIAIDPSDAISGDQFPNLLGTNQLPPNNQTGLVTGLQADYYITVYPWDGTSVDAVGDPEPNFDEMGLTVALTAGSTSVVVGASNIPDNTPTAGFIRVERDSDNEYELLEYTSFDNGTGTFTLGGSTPTAGIAAGISNNVFRALIDQVAGGTQASYTAVVGVAEQVAITAKRGGTSAPIRPAKATATFGANGFNVNLQPVSDV